MIQNYNDKLGIFASKISEKLADLDAFTIEGKTKEDIVYQKDDIDLEEIVNSDDEVVDAYLNFRVLPEDTRNALVDAINQRGEQYE